MSDSGLTELDKKWFDFTSAYVTKLNEAKQDWYALTEEEQELAALGKLEMDMYNGGFLQFFCNWGYDCYLYAVRCLNKMQATQALGIIQSQFEIVNRLEGDERLQSYLDIYKLLTKEELEKINRIDEDYWHNTDDIMNKTFEIYAHLVQ